MQHLAGLHKKDQEKVDGKLMKANEWRIDLEENMRQFVSYGLEEAVNSLRASAEKASNKEEVEIGFARLKVREQRMQKTEAELKILRCAARVSYYRALVEAANTNLRDQVTLEAIRSVRLSLHLGMTEKAGEDVKIPSYLPRMISPDAYLTWICSLSTKHFYRLVSPHLIISFCSEVMRLSPTQKLRKTKSSKKENSSSWMSEDRSWDTSVTLLELCCLGEKQRTRKKGEQEARHGQMRERRKCGRRLERRKKLR